MHRNYRGTARLLILAAAALTAGTTGIAFAHGTKVMERPATMERAAAEKAALMQVPNGTIKAARLEKKRGTPVWAFDVAQLGSGHMTEVRIDANNGHILYTGPEHRLTHARAHTHHQRSA